MNNTFYRIPSSQVAHWCKTLGVSLSDFLGMGAPKDFWTIPDEPYAVAAFEEGGHVWFYPLFEGTPGSTADLIREGSADVVRDDKAYCFFRVPAATPMNERGDQVIAFRRYRKGESASAFLHDHVKKQKQA